MTNKPDPNEVRKWHEWFAVECSKTTWKLIGKTERTAAVDRQMLYVAHAAAFHWSMVGAPLDQARAELALSRVFAILGHATDALRYAQRFLAYCDNNPCDERDVALGYVAMSHAGALLRDKGMHGEFYQAAEEKARALETEQDLRSVEVELARVPRL
jgi:hypothetical protein